MRNRWRRGIASMVVASALMVGGQAMAAGPTTQQQQSNPVDALNHVLPEVNLDNVALDDLIDFLRDTAGLQAMVVRDANVPDGFPQIRLRVKNLTLQQVLDVLAEAYPSVEMHRSDSGVTVIRVHASPDSTAAPVVRVYNLDSVVNRLTNSRVEAYMSAKNIPQGPVPGPGAFGPGGAVQQGAAPQQVTQQMLEELKKEVEKDQKAALDNTLSVVKAALGQAPNGASAVLEVHEPTLTLIFKGTDAQRTVVEQTLTALDPPNGVNIPELAHMEELVARAEKAAEGRPGRVDILSEQVEEAEKDLAAAAARVRAQAEKQDGQGGSVRDRADVERDIERLLKELRSAQSGPNPATQPAAPPGK